VGRLDSLPSDSYVAAWNALFGVADVVEEGQKRTAVASLLRRFQGSDTGQAQAALTVSKRLRDSPPFAAELTHLDVDLLDHMSSCRDLAEYQLPTVELLASEHASMDYGQQAALVAKLEEWLQNASGWREQLGAAMQSMDHLATDFKERLVTALVVAERAERGRPSARIALFVAADVISRPRTTRASRVVSSRLREIRDNAQPDSEDSAILADLRSAGVTI